MKTLKTHVLLIIIFTNFTTVAQCFNDIKCGAYHTTLKRTDGTLLIFGAGGLGSLGNEDYSNALSPIPLGGTNNWLQTANGTFTTFAIKSDGTLWGTGFNNQGQLGINSTVEEIAVLAQIGTANNWKAIAPSNSFTIALKIDNTLWGWGQNDSYQMGDGSCCANRLAPAPIGTATDWKMVANFQVRTAFAIKNNGTLWVWGSNAAGLIGSNLQPSVAFPKLYNNDTDWASITLGNAHMLALKTNGTLWAWGGGGQGQTANDGTFGYYDAHQIGTSTWKTVAGGSNTSFGIKTDGTLWAWGKNTAGQLGLGSITPNQFAPVQIGTDTNWDQVDAGFEHAVALKTDGSLWAWGDNTYGQFGNGTTTGSLSPILIPVTGCTLANTSFSVNKNTLQLAPNPAKTSTTITYENATPPVIEVYTLLGVTIASYIANESKGSWEFNTSGLPAGVYVVVLKDKDTILQQKKLVLE